MKIFEVTIDNNPGAWKSGDDPHVLVPALNKRDAIQKVKDGWNKQLVRKEPGRYQYFYKIGGNYPIRINEYTEFSAIEIVLDGYMLTERAAKVKKIIE